MLSRRTILNCICPSTPFLIPAGALHAQQTIIFQSFHKRRLHSKHPVAPQTDSTRWRRVVGRPKYSGRDAAKESLTERAIFKQALVDQEMGDILSLYPTLVSRSQVTSLDVVEVVRILHNCSREYLKKGAFRPHLLKFADRIVHDLQTDSIPSHPSACLRLLSFFKDNKQFSEGRKFWSWLVNRGGEYVNARVYGAAIELLAYGGEPLDTLEEMYKEALRRFPDGFVEYHLSPDAVVPDRSKPTALKGIPMMLLQGIATARFVHGAWRSAYLALDTALRLYPDQTPSRFFDVAIYQRPLPEAYMVFLMACRSGVVLETRMLINLLKQIRASVARQSSLPMRLKAVERMLKAILVYVGVGGPLSGNHLSGLVIGLKGLLPDYVEGQGSEPTRIARLIFDRSRDLIFAFSRSGVPLTVSSMNGLIVMAGKACQPESIGVILNDMAGLGLEPDDVTYRCILAASGYLKEPDRVEASWRALVEAARKREQRLTTKDWTTLAAAGRLAGHTEFVQEERSRFGLGNIGTSQNSPEQTASDEVVPQEDPPEYSLYIESFERKVTPLATSVLSLIRSQKRLDFAESPITVAFDEDGSWGPRQQLRRVYDELTSTPELPVSKAKRTDMVKTSTGYTIEQLRFENWVSINELLRQAETSESEAVEATDKVGIEETSYDGTESRISEDGDLSYSRLKEKILRLRGMEIKVT